MKFFGSQLKSDPVSQKVHAGYEYLVNLPHDLLTTKLGNIKILEIVGVVQGAVYAVLIICIRYAR